MWFWKFVQWCASEKGKNKGKFSPVHAVKAYRVPRGEAPLIIDPGTRSWCVVNLTPKPLYPRLDVLENSKLSCPYRNPNPGPSRP